MAYMFPQNIKKDTNSAEHEVYKQLQLGLPDEIVCYHTYEVNNNEVDFIIMLPGKGIVILEVKSWNGLRITKIINAEEIEYINNENKPAVARSPLTQCKKYTYILRDKIQKTFNKNIKVVPLICFPYMTEVMYKQKSMHIVVARERVILKEDLDDLSQLTYIIKQKFNSKKVGDVDPFDENTYIDICAEWFEDKKTIIERLEGYKPTRKIRRLFGKREYSILSYLKLDLNVPKELLRTELDSYFEQWVIGTKIVLIVTSDEEKIAIMSYLEEKIKVEMGYLAMYDDFAVYDTKKAEYKSRIFHFEVYSGKIDETIKSFKIRDGIDYESYDQELKYFDTHTDFNYKQYKVEHAKNDGNILVKAGAGTGKTYSMISRIGYLYYTKNYKPEDLLNAIVMITFTTDAADNMKTKLKDYFTNLAILTEETEYIHIMENISRMQISTIHSLMKKIIQTNGKYLGVGNEIKITTEKYEKQQLINKEIENFITITPGSEDLFGDIKKYEIRKAVEKFIDLLEKKNINLEYDPIFDNVQKDTELFNLIITVSSNVQKKIIAEHIKHNKVHLSNLTIYIEKVLRALDDLGENEQREAVGKIDYVFIDEFQDTDDVTIELIKGFYKLKPFNLFVVGDVKQSIYRFRGADDEAFTKLQEGMDNWVVDGKDGVLTLSKNYRSDEKLLEAFDHLFKKWIQGIGSFNQILKYEESDALLGVKSDERIKKPVKRINCTKDNFEQKLLDVIQLKLKELTTKYKDKPGKTGTIAILTRNNAEIEGIRRIGQNNSITIDTEKIENLYKMAPTVDLYRLILALQYNTNPKYLYSLSLSNYAPDISNKVVYKNKKNKDYIYNLFQENKIIPNWAQSARAAKENRKDESILGSLRGKTILRVIREINKKTKPWERYAAQFEEGERQLHKEHYKRNQDLLLERLIQMSGSDSLTINQIAKFLHIMIFTHQHQDERSHDKKVTNHTITCLTVHKSKGLEYDHVIIPYTATPLDQQYGSQVIKIDDVVYTTLVIRKKDKNKGEAGIGFTSQDYNKKTKQEKEDLVKEEARILYVALTRAEDTVTWFKHESKEERKGITWMDLLDLGGIDHE